MTGSLQLDHEVRMLIDGELVGAESGHTFENVNLATEQVLGVVADGSAMDMKRAMPVGRTWCGRH